MGVTGYILDGILHITSRRETDFALTTLTDFIFSGSKITADGHTAMKWCLFLGRNAMTNLDSILKTKDTLLTKVHTVKAMVFLAVMYRCERWTIKKNEGQRIDAFELWCWRRLLRVPWIARRSNQSILKESEFCLVKSDSLQPHGLYSPWNSPGQNTGRDSLSLLRRIFPTQGTSQPNWNRIQLQVGSLPAELQAKPILKEINPKYLLNGLMMKLKLQYLAAWCEEPTHWKRLWCWERLRAEREGDDRGWNGWMDMSLSKLWEIVKDREAGVLQSMGSQRVRT